MQQKLLSQRAGEGERAEAGEWCRGWESKVENGHNRTHAAKWSCCGGCEDTVGTEATALQ